jgi:cytochrome c oxidase subunit 2
LFVGWMLYFTYTLIRFREKKNPKADYSGVKSHASSYLEVTVALIEAVLLIGFAIPLWAKVVDDYPNPADATLIRVVAEQFSWNARYPGADGVFGKQDPGLVDISNKFGYDPEDPAGQDDVVPPMKDIHVPVDKPVLFLLSSLDVIHSLAIKPMRVCQDVIPGLRIPMPFTPTLPGGYKITCAQLCGNGHSSMDGYLTVHTQEDYDAWFAEKSAAGAPAPGGFE